ncbi:MAG: U32 family peptidase [Deltaproteobacteria bacterium]|nr:U32 family peptidase [Deltaproteobacteria bacterium]MBN2670076.1 U32 family peptidase [Deltaproteobacteria bacterium]
MAKLLAPAGNMEKLKVAVAYGADEVYFGLTEFSLRNFAGNFTLDEAETALAYLHAHDIPGYVTLNIYPFETEYQRLIETAHQLAEMGADGIIVSDLGVISALKKAQNPLPIHISTQANTLSPQTVMAYRALGASRVNLARELSIEQIESLQQNITQVETEVFVHGAVCFSYSGRCAISDYTTGRRANRGECTHPCRWQYTLIEKERPDDPFTGAEDERGLYLFNSKDLALFSFIPRLQAAGVHAFKIEGRMKSIHYLAGVLWLYRKIIDGQLLDNEFVMQMLSRVMNRGYSTGFMKGHITPDDYRFDDNSTRGHSKFLGIITDDEHSDCRMDIRNRVEAGTDVEIFTPNGDVSEFTLPAELLDTDGNSAKVLNHGKTMVFPVELPPYSIIRKLNS